MRFHACPECGATVRADKIEQHEQWHRQLHEDLQAPVEASLELDEWPGHVADEGPARHEVGGL